MRKKTLSVLLGIALAIIMLFGLLPACGETGNQVSSTNPASPVAAGEVFNWRYQSNSSAGTATYWTEEEFVSIMKKASGGRMNLDLQPAGAIVGSMEIFDAVATGAIETGNSWDCYFQGKDQRFNLVGMITAHFTWQQAAAWFYADSTGGQKAAEDLFAKFGIMRIQKTIAETEVETMSNKKLEKPEDFKGLTFRGAGYAPLILQEPEFGAAGVILAPADIYTSLQTRVIDACEASNAFAGFASGYHEVTKYWSFPGIHKLCETTSFIINLDLWKKLPEDLQWIIKTTCVYNNIRNWAFTHVESAKIIPILQDKFGIVIYRESPELQKLWKTVGWRLADGYAAKLPEFKVMWDEMKAFMNILGPYEELQTVTYAK